MRQKSLKYEKIEDHGAEKVLRWNACQIASKQLYKSSQKTDEIVAVVRSSFEDKVDIEIKLKK